MFAENRNPFVVSQGTDLLAKEFDLDDIEPEMAGHGSALPQVGEGAAAERVLFPAVDRVKAGYERPGLTGPHFDEDENVVLAGDDVDLVPAVRPVAGENPGSPLVLEPLRRTGFRLGPRPLLPCRGFSRCRRFRAEPPEQPGKR